jgi:hypothetical protein
MRQIVVLALLAVLVMGATAWAASTTTPGVVARPVGAGAVPPAPVVLEPVPVVTEPVATEPAKSAVPAEELKTAFRDAPLVIAFETQGLQGNPDPSDPHPWEVTGTLIEVFKGKLSPGSVTIHMQSVAKGLGVLRADLKGKEFVAFLRPLTNSSDRQFVLVGPSAFASAGPEALYIRSLAQADTNRGTGGPGLELTVRTIGKVFPVVGPKTVEVRLTNNGSETASYLQAPICERDGNLYLTGQGMLRVRDIQGRIIPYKANVMAGQPPKGPPAPAMILAGANFTLNVDLSKYYDLPEGRYTLAASLAAPDARSAIASGLLSFQVGGAPPVEPTPAPTKTAEPVRPPESVESTEPPLPAVVAPKRPTGPVIPDPSKYAPGKSYKGLSALLKPVRAKTNLGDPIEVEFRLINEGPMTQVVDSRLERTLTITVQAVADSPEPLRLHQVIRWPADGATAPDERAFLRDGAFWGRTINLNILGLKGQDEFKEVTAEEIAPGKNMPYERFGKYLFGFPKPGVYTITAKYLVTRPAVTDTTPGADPRKDWWSGEIETNRITIQIMEPGDK